MNLVAQTPQLIYEGYLHKRMLFGWRKHYCILRGRNMELYRVITTGTTTKPKENPSRILVVEQFHADYRASDQFDVIIPRGTKKTFKLEPDQIKRGERTQWIQALQTALLCDNALERYGEDITKQLMTYANRQVSEHGSLRLDDSMWKTLRKRSIHGDLWSRFQALIAKGVEVTEVVEPPAQGLLYLFRIDDPATDILLLPLDDHTPERRIPLRRVLGVADCVSSGDATQRLTRFNLTHVVDDESVIETFQTHTTDMRSRLVFGLSHILKNVQYSPKQQMLRRLTVSPPRLERTSDASSRSVTSLDGSSQLDAVIRSFNMNPKRGIAFGIDQGVIDDDQAAVADFLRQTKGLDKDKIGEYLGGDDSFGLQVLAAFAQSFEFGNKPFELCLREFLSKFRLPGESQKIDRVMEAFAKAFHAKNPTMFTNHDVVYILAFSTIMLNTDLHNPSMNNRKRMTKEEFVRNNRGIDKDKTDIAPSILHAIFDNIKKQPLVTVRDRDDNGNLFANPDMSGWLKNYRRSGIKTPRRWFMLSNHCLYFFENEQGIDPLGFYSLENVKVLAILNRPCCFELRAANSSVKSTLYPKRARIKGSLSLRWLDRVVFVAESTDQAKGWVDMIEKHILQSEQPTQMLKKSPQRRLPSTSKRDSISTSYEDVVEEDVPEVTTA
ncbi:Cytohesin-1 [Aphanomyces cochlioides]|nr:Cytohesin-1 [Aphanomyces cochlioides]